MTEYIIEIKHAYISSIVCLLTQMPLYDEYSHTGLEIYISTLSNLYSLCMPAPTLSRVTLTQLVHKIFSGGCYNNARPDLSSNML